MTDRPGHEGAGIDSRMPGPAFLFSVALGLVLLCLVVSKGIQDSDFFWHLTAGELIASTGEVPSVDPFSFTWAGQPWTPRSWLSELAGYWLVSIAGEAGALLAVAVMPGVIFGVLAFALTQEGVRTRAFALPMLLGAWTLLPYVTLRPQVTSWLLTAVAVSVLMSAREGRTWVLLILPPLLVLWANLHGAWVIGLAVIGLYTLMTLIGRTPMRLARGRMLAVMGACILAAALTPAGLAGILYPLQYLDPASWALENIAEWQSPDFHDPTHWSVLILIVALALNRGRATPAWLAILPVIGILMSLLSIRNVPFLAIWSIPTLAYGLSDRLKGHEWFVPPDRRAGMPIKLIELGLAIVVVAAAFVTTYPADVRTRVSDETERRYPVAGVDRLADLDPDARVLAEYNWGGYVISRLYEVGGRVFVDGRDGEMYSEAVLNEYTDLVAARPGWERLLEDYGVEAILLRPVAPLVKGLVQEAGWCEAYRDAEQVLLFPPGSCQ